MIAQWQRWRDWQQPSAGLWYWRDQSGNEVDLLIERRGRLTAIECKLAERPSSNDTSGLRRLVAFYGEKAIAGLFVACSVGAPFALGDGMNAVPGWTVFDV